MKYTALLLSSLLLLSSCSSTQLVSSWKNTETPVYESNKVLVIGLSNDINNRRMYEGAMSTRLESQGVVAVRSVDFFESSFLVKEQSEADLDAIEIQLLDAGFDAILFTKIIGVTEKVTMVQSFRDIGETFDGFAQDYLISQKYYETRSVPQEYTLYHTQTNLYCICPGEARELLWSGNIDVVNGNFRRNINDYVQLLVSTLKEAQLVIVKD
ncbi:hypothetical protein [Gilvibacter sp.]|uniref:hypothetical protein n=1 Tax=Gilvibacter sp. TaxID=2729997 RepID=UPI003F49DA05